MFNHHSTRLAGAVAIVLTGCTVQRWQPLKSTPINEHAIHALAAAPPAGFSAAAVPQGADGVPAGNADAAARLNASPRKGEYTRFAYEPGSRDSLAAWISYPQAREKAPVVVVIHDNQGLSTWVRGVADQLAADGFVAIAPDLISKARGGASEIELAGDSVRRIIGGVTNADRRLGALAAANHAMSLPTAERRYGIVGYCWGGAVSFDHAVFSPSLGAAVVFYGNAPNRDSLSKISAPVLGLYGGTDARIGATVPGTDSSMKQLGKTYEPHTFEGADHGFLRSQSTPANVEASRKSWPMAVAFFRKHLGVK